MHAVLLCSAQDTAACTGVEVEAAAEAEGKMLEDAAADKSAGEGSAAHPAPVYQHPTVPMRVRH